MNVHYFKEDEDGGDDEEDDDDGFFVPHGYLSDDEGALEEEVWAQLHFPSAFQKFSPFKVAVCRSSLRWKSNCLSRPGQNTDEDCQSSRSW